MITGNQGAMEALMEVDLLAHSIRRGTMRIWNRIVLRDSPNQGSDIE